MDFTNGVECQFGFDYLHYFSPDLNALDLKGLFKVMGLCEQATDSRSRQEMENLSAKILQKTMENAIKRDQ